MILRVATLLLFTALLSGCGQKGPLVLATEPAPQASAPQAASSATQEPRPPQASPNR